MNLLEDIKEGKEVLILTHHNADIDAVGASIALYECLEGADLAVPDSISKGAEELGREYSFLVNPELQNYETVVILDCPSKEQLEPINIENFPGKIVLIDHHSKSNLEEIADILWIEEEAKSTSEMLYQLLKEDNINRKAATALICGIVADTSHLKLAGSKQFKYISELLSESERSYSEVLSLLSTPTDFSERIARTKAASRTEGYRFGKNIVVFSSVGSFEAASARSLLRTGVDIAIVFSPRKEEMRISGRCRRNLTSKIHLADDLFSEVEEVINGSAGGHDAAASANGKNMDKEEIKEEMLKRLEEVFGKKAETIT